MPIPVFIISSDDVVAMASVTMISILENTKSDIKFIILEDDRKAISEKNRNFILQLKNRYKNMSFEIKTIQSKQFEPLQMSAVGYIPIDTYFRYLIPDLCLEFDKGIYIDYDTVVTGDISELFNVDLDSFSIGAVRNDKGTHLTPGLVQIAHTCGLTNPENYFNAGVLLLNLKKCREINASNRLFNISLSKGEKFKLADQDALNNFFKDDNLELEEKFNTYADRINVDKLPLIIHYVGPYKPWKVRDNKLSNFFWEYAAKSPWLEHLRSIQSKKSIINRYFVKLLGLELFRIIQYHDCYDLLIFKAFPLITISKSHNLFALKLFNKLSLIRISKK